MLTQTCIGIGSEHCLFVFAERSERRTAATVVNAADCDEFLGAGYAAELVDGCYHFVDLALYRKCFFHPAFVIQAVDLKQSRKMEVVGCTYTAVRTSGKSRKQHLVRAVVEDMVREPGSESFEHIEVGGCELHAGYSVD